MSFDNLPYETQFKFLVDLPYKDTINYCRISTAAYTICLTNAFWNYKAKKTFGIDLNVIRGKETGAKQYHELEDLYYNQPGLLVTYLVDAEKLSQIPPLLKRVTKEKIDMMSEVLITLVKKKSARLMEDALIIFKDVLTDLVGTHEINDTVRNAYFDAILNNQMELVNILKRYYDPNMDDSEYVNEWLNQWAYESNSITIALLTAAGVSFDRLF